ncbi:MFS transporter [Kutzneria sp. CA-103260]|uniref:MFS transporter n=1 Tax=Kutzneria sp. CA-103260 TaxID=2802641 RepID=UPI001BAB6DB9|nr:MFS transporter [Kutzneria sp. CA-103260]QUQ62919.1 Major Facilitator Superfamily protein [Kutzneria sp. CA-103260]
MSVLWQRRLDHYPETRQRLWYLAIVVVATVVLYYELYVPGAVATEIIAQYHMSFTYYVYISVVGNAVGAFSSLLAGLADRWGRANLVAYGLGLTGVLTLFGVPNAPDQLTFAILFAVISFVEGIILVATPALVRDFSPQLGRASAMGFWTLGPVVGSLVLSEVSSNTIEALPAWQSQFVICGIVGLVVFVIALFGLRELSPNLRDQLMVSMRDRELIEARAAGIDVDKAIERPWRQMMTLPVIGSAFAISVFLILYYTAVGFFTIYFTTIYGFSLADANGIGNWFWGVDALALIVVGVVSDRLRVRKPFMLVGALGAIVMTIVFLSRATAPDTGYYTFVWIISALAMFMAVAYAPWMASFTETVERINPALTATGLAVWGWIVRACVALSVFALPFVVTSMTPLVQYGTQVATLAAKYDAEIKTIGVVDPATLAALGRNPSDPEAGTKAVAEIMQAQNVDQTTALQRLRAAAAVPKADLAFLQEHATEVQNAAAATPGQWQNWWWVCVGGEAVFLPLIFVMVGRWRPSRARADLVEHQARVDEELEQLSSSTGGTVQG